MVETLFLIIKIAKLFHKFRAPFWIALIQSALNQISAIRDRVRTFAVIAKDYEQEACFVFSLWALVVMVRKGVLANRERSLVGKDLIGLREGMRVLPEDTREYLRHLDQLPADTRHALLPRALYAALERWAADDLRSVNAQIEYLLTRAAKDAGRLKDRKKEEGE